MEEYCRWTEYAGNHEVKAKFVSAEGGQVDIAKRNGQTVCVPVDRLSEKDKRYLLKNVR